MPEIILAMVTAALTIQVLILQRHYTNTLSELSILLNSLLDIVEDKKVNRQNLDKIRLKIFNSSQ